MLYYKQKQTSWKSAICWQDYALNWTIFSSLYRQTSHCGWCRNIVIFFLQWSNSYSGTWKWNSNFELFVHTNYYNCYWHLFHYKLLFQCIYYGGRHFIFMFSRRSRTKWWNTSKALFYAKRPSESCWENATV